MNYTFDEFTLDLRLFELRRDGVRSQLEPQVFDVLAYLVQHHDRVVTKDELIEHVWGDRFISEAALTSRLMAARKALGDSGREQRYIKTVHGRGYRFAAAVEQHDDTAAHAATSATVAVPPAAKAAATLAVGREAELAQLESCFDAAVGGERRIVFVTGEAGIGKTTLVNAFLERARAKQPFRLAWGQCIEHRGTGEAYLPIFDALNRMARSEDTASVIDVLHKRAPAWLAQMPSLLSADQIASLQPLIAGNTQERMLREMVDAIEAMAAGAPLVLVIDDLHWSDHSTIDLLSWLARRDDPARLMVIGTYRPSDVRASGHPVDALQHELRLRGRCQELALPFLSEDAVGAYLRSRLGDSAPADALSPLIFRRTEGSPLFVVSVVDVWLARGVLASDDGHWTLRGESEEIARGIPETLRQMIEQQIEALDDTSREVLEAASVIGSEFSDAAVAAVTGIDRETVEYQFTAIAREGRFVVAGGERDWDGMPATNYTFLHSLYEELLYARLSRQRLRRLHAAAGDRLEAAYGAPAAEHAVELAMHFVRAHDAPRAIAYLRLAADAAMTRGGYREAVGHLTTALELIEAGGQTEDRAEVELSIQSRLGGAMVATRGFGSAEAKRALTRALELATNADEVQRVAVMCDLAALLEYEGSHKDAERLLRQLEHAPLGQNSVLVPYHALLSCSYFHQGLFRDAVEHAGQGLSVYVPGDPFAAKEFLGDDAGAGCREWSALSLWFLGYPDDALATLQALLDMTSAPGMDYTLASSKSLGARLHQLRREPRAARDVALESVALATRQGFAYHGAVGMIVAGWALAAEGSGEEGVAQLRMGLDAHAGTGAEMDRPYYLAMLGDALRGMRRQSEALDVVEEALALVHSDRPFFYEAELRRMRGELRADRNDRAGAESDFRDAIAVAADQQAKSLELRAACSLARVLQARGETAEARALLAPLVAWFTQGQDSRDLVEAREVLDTLGDATGKRAKPRGRGKR